MGRSERAFPKLAPFLLAVLMLLRPGPLPAATAPEFDRATALSMAGDNEGALRLYRGFLSEKPLDRLAPVAALAIANLELLARHDTAAAVAGYDRILQDYRTSPYAPEAARQKALCAEAQKKWAEAAQSYEQALEVSGERKEDVPFQRISELAMSAAQCYEKAGNQTGVASLYHRILEGSPPPEVAGEIVLRMAESDERAGNAEGAAEGYAKVVRDYPSAPVWTRALGKKELVDRYVKFDWSPYQAFAEGTQLYTQNNFPACLDNCKKVLASNASPALRELAEYRQIALEAALAGDYTEGCRRLRAYIERYPDGLRARQARTALETNWSQIADMETLVLEHPDDAQALAALGQRYLQVNNAAKGAQMLEKAAALSPDDGQIRMSQGAAYAALGRPEDAVKCYNLYLEKNPKDITALNLIGYNYIAQGQAEQAIPYFQRYAAQAPEDPNAHDSLGEGFFRSGKLAEAEAEYEKAVSLDTSFSSSYFMLGQIYTRLHKPEKAILAYERFLELNASGPQAVAAQAAADSLRQSGAPKGGEKP